jgi:glutathione S-transferase
MKLYYAPGACSLAVHIVLRELGREFSALPVDLATHKLPDGTDYRSISPRGYVPLLELDDGSRHTEVAALLQHLADQEQSQSLIGAVGSTRRLAVTQWLAFVGSELHKTFSPWLWNKDTAQSTRVAVLEKLAARFSELEGLLGQSDYLAGSFSVADAYAFTILNWANYLAISLSEYPSLQRYLTRMSQRDSVRQTMVAEGLVQ